MSTAAGRDTRTGMKAAACLLLVLLGTLALNGCSLAARTAVDTFDAAGDDARARACYASQRMVEGAAQLWKLDHDEQFPTAIEPLVPKYLPEMPACLAGGAYSLEIVDGDPICSCSVHGHYPADE